MSGTFGNYTDDWTEDDYLNVETYLDNFTADGWKDQDCVDSECEEQLLEAEIAGTECDPAPNNPFNVACYYPEESMYDERGNLISLYHNYSRRVSWSPQFGCCVLRKKQKKWEKIKKQKKMGKK